MVLLAELCLKNVSPRYLPLSIEAEARQLQSRVCVCVCISSLHRWSWQQAEAQKQGLKLGKSWGICTKWCRHYTYTHRHGEGEFTFFRAPYFRHSLSLENSSYEEIPLYLPRCILYQRFFFFFFEALWTHFTGLYFYYFQCWLWVLDGT